MDGYMELTDGWRDGRWKGGRTGVTVMIHPDDDIDDADDDDDDIDDDDDDDKGL